MKRRIELVVHCWKFSRALRYLLESLVRHPPEKVDVSASICFSYDDLRTVNLLKDVERIAIPWSIKILPHPLPTPQLFNRTIGRNERALATEADFIWFTDCDYFFGQGCLDSLADVPIDPREPDYSPLYYPRVVMISKDHATGDAYLKRADGSGPVSFDPADFVPRREKRAIGGIQIVPGDVARVVGYANNPWHLRPVTNGKWARPYGDTFMRRVLGTRGKPIDVSNCYRIRQSIQWICDEL